MFSQTAFTFFDGKGTYTPVAKGGQTMGVLDKLIGRKKAILNDTLATVDTPHCPHVTLVPKWGNTADMGHEDKATGYDCDSCKETFTAEQGRDLRRTEAERLRHNLEV